MQAIQPGVSKAVLAIQVLQRDQAIDGGIPDVYTTEEVRKFRESDHTDDQIKRLGGMKLARKANRAKKREEDVVEISDDEGEKTGSTTSADSKFVRWTTLLTDSTTTLLTDSTKSRTKTTLMSQTPATTSSRSQVQLMVATIKVP
uniref:Uncharacterized protein n=1 Tax=Romanomermis culicivorax TaxID=13658 RepID=A0A915IQ01_ROMCU